MSENLTSGEAITSKKQMEQKSNGYEMILKLFSNELQTNFKSIWNEGIYNEFQMNLKWIWIEFGTDVERI